MKKILFLKKLLILLLSMSQYILSQTFHINGNISTAIVPVKNAEVTFIDANDTTKKYYTLTDNLGKYQLNLITAVNKPDVTLPTKFELAQNYPNPFSGETTITYNLKEPIDVRVKIYNVLGQEIRTFNIGEKFNGIHGIRWDGRDNFRNKAAYGIYFYMMQAGKETQVKKMIFGLGSSGLNHPNLTIQFPEKSLYVAKAQTTDQLKESGNNIFRVRITNSSSTQPQIYSRVFENFIIQRDTTLNFVVDVLGPWRKVKSGITDWLYDIDFPDSKNGWVVGSRGLILNSNDGGETWQQQICPITEPLNAVDFVDKETGWICSNSSILKTADGGKNWIIKYSEDMIEGRFHDIQFLNNKIGFAVGGKSFFGLNGVLLKTTDGGETWQDVIPERLPTLTHISIVDEQNIWICGFGSFGGTLLFTSNLRLTWTKKSLNAPVSWLRAIQFVDKYHGWVGCDDDDAFNFFRTTDGGNTWKSESKETWPLGKGTQSFFFVDSLKGWLGTVPGASTFAIINTTDGGQTWEYLPAGTNIYDVKSFSFINKELGWAVGSEVENAKNKNIILLYNKQ
ncbi:MAG: T9SS type A sorting domain-containing protein [Ignavibacteriales bacterium]|nr:T9SS type A sorting domain-containing protein [Ignavibacteriales bacterium]